MFAFKLSPHFFIYNIWNSIEKNQSNKEIQCDLKAQETKVNSKRSTGNVDKVFRTRY